MRRRRLIFWHAFAGTSGITETTADDAVFTRKGDGVGSILTKEGGARETLFKTLYALGSQRYSASWKVRGTRDGEVRGAGCSHYV